MLHFFDLRKHTKTLRIFVFKSIGSEYWEYLRIIEEKLFSYSSSHLNDVSL